MAKKQKNTTAALQSKPSEDLAPLNIIRTETIFSKLPIHNLAKRGSVDIQITRTNESGEVELYWKISPNRDYGEPRQLAYKLDTVVINRRIDAYGKELPSLMRVGATREICRELGLAANGTNFSHINKAMKQNAGAFITTKMSYKDSDGTERQLEAGFTRYGVYFTGERLPDGSKADAIYVSFNDPYYSTLKTAPARPLDYDYLKELLPAAQRFYEIISYSFFAALKSKQSQAKLRYSKYCLYSAQSRYYDYDHFKKQMYKIHKPHLDSGYIKAVEYQQERDEDGKIDWLMTYTIGPKAVAEYRTFNGKTIDVEAIAIETKRKTLGTKTARSVPVKKERKVATSRTKIKESPGEPSLALKLVQDFHKQVRGVDGYQPYIGSKEESQAEALLATYGLEKFQYILTFAIAQARKTNFEMRTFGAIFQYVNDAVAECERREQELARQRAQEEAARQVADRQLQTLSKKEYSTLYKRAKEQILSDLPALASQPESEMLQSLIRTEMLSWLAQKKSKTKDK
jgi:hypothetical protein